MTPVKEQPQLVTMDGSPLPDKYAKLTQKKGLPPTGRLRLFLQGKVGSGKSTFACSFPGAAILDFENKTSAVRNWGKGSQPFHFRTQGEYDKLIDELVADGYAGKRCFDMVVFDTVLAYRDMRRRAMTELYKKQNKLKGPGDITDYKSEGAGWSLLNMAVNSTFDRLAQAGYGWIALAHIVPKWRDVGGESRCSWESVLNAGVLDYLHTQCEFCAFFAKDRKEVLTQGRDRIVSGKTFPGQPIKTIVETYQLTFLPPDPRLAVREHVPLAGKSIDIPEGEGYNAFDRAYTTAGKAWMEGKS